MTGDGLIDGLPRSAFTRLTDERIDEIRARARAQGTFVDPRVLRAQAGALLSVTPRWAHAVLGRPFRGPHTDSWQAFLTLVYAMEAEPDPPSDPVRTAADRAEEERQHAEAAESARRAQERDTAWEYLRAHLPVASVVRYNYASRFHTEWYSAGAKHVVVLDELRHGRRHRTAAAALCETRSRRLEFVVDGPAGRDVPTCRACLRTAARIASTPEATAAAELLSGTSRRAPRTPTAIAARASAIVDVHGEHPEPRTSGPEGETRNLNVPARRDRRPWSPSVDGAARDRAARTSDVPRTTTPHLEGQAAMDDKKIPTVQQPAQALCAGYRLTDSDSCNRVRSG
jgi:hypothetical protein